MAQWLYMAASIAVAAGTVGAATSVTSVARTRLLGNDGKAGHAVTRPVQLASSNIDDFKKEHLPPPPRFAITTIKIAGGSHNLSILSGTARTYGERASSHYRGNNYVVAPNDSRARVVVWGHCGPGEAKLPAESPDADPLPVWQWRTRGFHEMPLFSVTQRPVPPDARLEELQRSPAFFASMNLLEAPVFAFAPAKGCTYVLEVTGSSAFWDKRIPNDGGYLRLPFKHTIEYVPPEQKRI